MTKELLEKYLSDYIHYISIDEFVKADMVFKIIEKYMPNYENILSNN